MSEERINKNHIYFYADVEGPNIGGLLSTVLITEKELKIAALLYETEMPTLHLHIHSYGGSLRSGIAAYDTLRTYGEDHPFHTHIEGAVASAATLLSLAGNYRTITKNSMILVHQLSQWFNGTYEQLKDTKLNSDILMEQAYSIYEARTKLDRKTLKKLMRHDLWLDAKKAVEYGFVDEII